jgi:hypothetical protein
MITRPIKISDPISDGLSQADLSSVPLGLRAVVTIFRPRSS